MGAQVVREVSMQTNAVAGDGTTTAIVLANALVQTGAEALDRGAKAIDLCRGVDLAVAKALAGLKAAARPAKDEATLASVAAVAATDPKLGALVARAFALVGTEGVITTEFGLTTETTIDVQEGMSFDRGYLSHHMATDQETMTAVLECPLILMTDLKIRDPASLEPARAIAARAGRPLMVIAEEVSPEVVASLLGGGAPGRFLVVHPPEYGHWRKALLEDLAILTGGRVIARDLGGRVEDVTEADLGAAARVKTGASHTAILRGEGDPAAIAARRAQVQRQHDNAPPNIEQDKLRERLAKLSGGAAVLYAGGVTPVEQKRNAQLIEDALHAVRAAAEDGVVAGGGAALAHIAPTLDPVIADAKYDVAEGARLVQAALERPLWRIVSNAGGDGDSIVAEARRLPEGTGFNAVTGRFQDMFEAGVVDPLRVTSAALANAASVATLILTTETLVGDYAEADDPTAGPSRGGGAEDLPSSR